MSRRHIHSKERQSMEMDDLIVRLLSVGQHNQHLTKTVKEAEMVQLCTYARNVFLGQSAFIEVNPPVKVCGDTHGQYADVLRLFDRGGFPPLVNYLFLGDYVDRGHQNLENICLLLAYKVKYPNNFFLLRGNHECAQINRIYGFYEECSRRYQSVHLWQSFQEAFSCMPLSGLIGGRILCMHGGLSPKLKSFDQLRNVQRPMDPPNPSLYIDLMWSDPDQNQKGWASNARGLSYIFGTDVVHDMCKFLDIDLVARAHQVVQDGYEFFANRKLVTIFSAPHYCGQFDNAAAIMNVDENLTCSFMVLRPVIKSLKMRK